MDNLNMNGGNSVIPAKNKPVGPVIGLIVIIILILLGGLYFWGARDTLNNGVPMNDDTSGEQSTPATEEAIRNQSTSDNPTEIEADLETFNEADIDAIDSDL